MLTFVNNTITFMNRRLQQFLDAENITQAQFASMIHVAPASISHILAGRNRPGFDFMQNAMKAFPDLNIEWLITGKGKMYKSAKLVSQEISPADDMPDSLFGNIRTGEESVEEIFPVMEDSPGIPKKRTEVQHEANIKILQGSDSPAEPRQSTVNQRKAIKIVIFYDDGTFQELL